jgi:hypothetical protein
MDHQTAQDRGEPGHNDIRESALFQKREEPSHKESGVGPDQGDLMARREDRQGLLKQFDAAIGRAGFAGAEGDPQQPPGFTQKRQERVMRGAAPFLRIIANLAALLAPIPAKHRGIQVECMAQ